MATPREIHQAINSDWWLLVSDRDRKAIVRAQVNAKEHMLAGKKGDETIDLPPFAVKEVDRALKNVRGTNRFHDRIVETHTPKKGRKFG